MNARTYIKDQVRTTVHTLVDIFLDYVFGPDDPENMKPERTQ